MAFRDTPGNVPTITLQKSYFVLLFVATMLLVWMFFGRGGELAAHQLLASQELTLEGFLTHQLFHVSGWHLSVNLLIILIAGGFLESFWGQRKFLIFSAIVAGSVAAVSLAMGQVVAGSDLYSDTGVRSYGASGLAFAYLVCVAVAFRGEYITRGISIRYGIWASIFFGAAGLAFLDASAASSDASISGSFLVPQISGVGLALGFLWIDPRVMKYRERRSHQKKTVQRELVLDIRLQVDELLAKISVNGFESLTPREKAFLRQASKHYKQEK